MALVMARDSPYKDGTFPSGTNWDDYANWCLAAYYTSENHASSLATSTVIDPQALPANDVAAAAFAGGAAAPAAPAAPDTPGGTVSQQPVPAEDHNHEEQRESEDLLVQPPGKGAALLEPPVGYFFKGFLAWSLFGPIPVLETSATTKTTQFVDSKVGTSYGKKKKSTCKKRAASLPVDPDAEVRQNDNNAKKCTSTNNNNGVPTKLLKTMSIISCEAGDSHDDSDKQFTDILRKSLTVMENDALEKEMQKNNFLQVRILRDKITSLTRQQICFPRDMVLC